MLSVIDLTPTAADRAPRLGERGGRQCPQYYVTCQVLPVVWLDLRWCEEMFLTLVSPAASSPGILRVCVDLRARNPLYVNLVVLDLRMRQAPVTQ